eukprot:TRINITY_DN16970_c0_g1_i3.p1 TRINITY_DN16970_c0_g1~~TRINITY_DN16970_c0_g1_i3.p1  ORF type:complete len:358 (+),score=135.80 TRINITY_DN16970_c0_g1_i3:47-1120(+)
MMRFAVVFAALGLASAAEEGEHLSLLWLYDELDERGPSNWGNVTKETEAKYPTCASGMSQSPLDIASIDIDNSLQGMQFSYHAAAGLSVSNTGATVRVVPANNHGNHFVDPNLGDKNWSLAQMHFHAPSEHMLGGGYFDLELHLVHTPAEPTEDDAAYDLAVVGVMFRVSASPNNHLNFFDSLPSLPAEIASHDYYDDGTIEYSPNHVDLPSMFDFGSLLMTGRYYTYNGSLTTPPCSEKVKWIVMSDVNQISQAQLDRFTAAMGFTDRKAKAMSKGHTLSPFDVYGNNRPVQARNGRAVRAYTGVEVQCDSVDTAYDLGLAGVVMSAAAIFLVAIVLGSIGMRSPSSGNRVKPSDP